MTDGSTVGLGGTVSAGFDGIVSVGLGGTVSAGFDGIVSVGLGGTVSAGLDGVASVGPVGSTGFAALVWGSVGVVLCVFSYVAVVYVRELRTS